MVTRGKAQPSPGKPVVTNVDEDVVPEGNDFGDVCDALPDVDDGSLGEVALEVIKHLRPLQ